MNTKKHISFPGSLVVMLLFLSSVAHAVSDNLVITMACVSDITVSIAPEDCNIALTPGIPTVNSTSPVVWMTNDFNNTADASGIYPLGVTRVTWTAINSDGESASCSMLITVSRAAGSFSVIQCASMDVAVGSQVPAPVVTSACEEFALRFDGVDDEVILDKDLGAVNTFTYELYVKPTTTHEVDTELLDDTMEGIYNQNFAIYPGYGEGAYGPGNSMVGISVGTNGVSVYEHSSGFLSAILVYETTLSQTAFTHIAVTLDSDGTTATCSLFINGVLVHTNTYAAPFPAAHTGIGYLGDGGIGGGYWGHFAGDIDNVSVWNHVRTASDISSSYANGLSGTEPGIVAHFSFNEGNGTIAHGPSGNAALMNNTAWVQPGVSAMLNLTNNITGNSTPPVFVTAGVYPITWTATDNFGNTTTCSADVTAFSPLSVSCPADIVVTATPGACGTYVNVPSPVITGGAPAWVVYNTYTQTLDASTVYQAGTTLVIWKVKKTASTTEELCAVRVTVLDKEGPAISSCPSDLVQELSGCGSPVNIDAPVAEDNCNNGWALRFDGVDDEVLIDRDLQTVDNFTLEFYVKPNELIDFDPSFTNQNYVIYPGNGANAYGPGHAIIGVSVGMNGIRVILNDNDVLADVLTYQTAFPANKWTHVALIINRNGAVAPCKFYINGTYIHSDGWPSPLVWHASLGFNPAASGGGIGGGTLGHFEGVLDELRIWDYERTIGELSSDRRKELTGIEPHLTAYIKFNEGPSSTRVTGLAGSYDLTNMNLSLAWAQPDAIDDLTMINSFNKSSSASDIYPVGVTQVTWTLTDKFGNTSTCGHAIQVNSVTTVALICPGDVTINNDPDKCSAPFTVGPPQVALASCEGYGLNFDGINDFVTMEKDLGVTDDFTIEMWVRPTNQNIFHPWGIYPGTRYAIYPNLPELYEVPNVVFGLTSHSTVGITVGTNGIAVYEHSYEYLPIQLSWSSPLPLTKWTHVAVVYSDDVITLYVDGEEKTAALRQIDGRTVHATLGIPGGGGGIGGGLYGSYEGDMDEVRIWDHPRTKQEIIHDKDIELKGTETGLKGYYNFNEGTGKSAATSKFGAAELMNMDINDDWIQPDPIKDFTLTNNFNGSGVVTQDFPVGETVVTWTLTDKYGVESICSSIVTVIDAQPPVVQCPASHTVYVPDGSFNTDIVFEDIIASDNCGIKSIVNTFNGGENPSGVFPVGTTDIIYTITDVNGNETPCTGVQIIVEPTKLAIPTGISPNGDGFNDAWILHGLEYFEHANVKIYNRNGDLVYEGNGYNNESTVFNGTGNRGLYSGSQTLPNGTYFYHLKTVPDNQLKDFTGFIEISK